MNLATIPGWLVPTLKQAELDLAPKPGMVHHRGQLTLYLRLREVPLPSAYEPTADV